MIIFNKIKVMACTCFIHEMQFLRNRFTVELFLKEGVNLYKCLGQYNTICILYSISGIFWHDIKAVYYELLLDITKT